LPRIWSTIYLAERHRDGWLARLDELEALAADGISTVYPGHGSPGDLGLVAQTRRYLRDFAAAIGSGDAKAAEAAGCWRSIRNYHARQFLTAFSIPAYFPSTAPT